MLGGLYGSPTAAADLQHFHDTFFTGLPNPNFQQVFPQGNPQYKNACSASSGQSGPCAAAGWSGEATLDIEWAYSIAPLAHLILLAVPPAETEGVQGLPNLFKAISSEIDAAPAGTLFSMSFGITEQTFGGAAGSQTSKFDAVFQKGLAKHDNFFAASGDDGSTGVSKQHKDTGIYSYPTVGWPASSPYVVSVGGTQLQRGWTWNPSSNDAFTASGDFNPAYWQWTSGGNTEAVWNESWGPIGTGGGASALYPRPSWQSGVAGSYGDHRIVPDTAWNAAVNGGVAVYITADPQYNCGNTTGCWTVAGRTSAATPRTAALVALANAARSATARGPIGFLDPICTAVLAPRRIPIGWPVITAVLRPRSPAAMSGSAALSPSRLGTWWTTRCGRFPSTGIRPRPDMTRPPAGAPRGRPPSSRGWRPCHSAPRAGTDTRVRDARRSVAHPARQRGAGAARMRVRTGWGPAWAAWCAARGGTPRRLAGHADQSARHVLACLGHELRALGVVSEHPFEDLLQGGGIPRGEAQADGAVVRDHLAQPSGVRYHAQASRGHRLECHDP